jgi:hypothetical protein
VRGTLLAIPTCTLEASPRHFRRSTSANSGWATASLSPMVPVPDRLRECRQSNHGGDGLGLHLLRFRLRVRPGVGDAPELKQKAAGTNLQASSINKKWARPPCSISGLLASARRREEARPPTRAWNCGAGLRFSALSREDRRSKDVFHRNAAAARFALPREAR